MSTLTVMINLMKENETRLSVVVLLNGYGFVFLLATPHGMWELSFRTRIESITPEEEAQSLKWFSRKVPEFYSWNTNTLKERLEMQRKLHKWIPKQRLFKKEQAQTHKERGCSFC